MSALCPVCLLFPSSLIVTTFGLLTLSLSGEAYTRKRTGTTVTAKELMKLLLYRFHIYTLLFVAVYRHFVASTSSTSTFIAFIFVLHVQFCLVSKSHSEIEMVCEISTWGGKLFHFFFFSYSMKRQKFQFFATAQFLCYLHDGTSCDSSVWLSADSLC